MWHLVGFYSSVIMMMHGPIHIKRVTFIYLAVHSLLLLITNVPKQRDLQVLKDYELQKNI